MTVMSEQETHILVVGGPARDRLYERFSRLYQASSDVLVVKERRSAERRHADGQIEGERRRIERRSADPWHFPTA